MKTGISFARWYGVALIAHAVGNWSQPDFPDPVGVANLAVGLLGIALAAYPTGPLLIPASMATLASLGLEVPFTGNHWVVAGLAALGILLGRGRFDSYAPALRTMFLVFYGFAAFSKLNSAFFDPSVSCALFYANQSLHGFGFIPIASSSPIAELLIWLTALIELSVVPLLVLQRTRRLGVLVAATFHILISFDLNQHFYDFTSVILAILILFLPDATGPTEIPLPNQIRRAIKVLATGGAVFLVALAVLPVSSAGLALLRSLPFLAWLPLCIYWLWATTRSTSGVASVSFRLSWTAAIVAGVAMLNGLTPYFEVKTAYSFNMYSNLVTAQGETNHFIVPRTMPLRDDYELSIAILSSTDDGLEAYAQADYAIPLAELERYAAGTEIDVVAVKDGAIVNITGRDLEHPEAWERWLPLRSFDLRQPARCQDSFLPAL